MKKVLSVALASAMVLGMGANAFAISYSTGSNQEADWPDGFEFGGSLFVTNADGDLIEESTTELNDSESVDFEPGDVIWMPLYAENQVVYTSTYEKGESEKDAVTSVKVYDQDDVDVKLSKGEYRTNSKGEWIDSDGADAEKKVEGWYPTKEDTSKFQNVAQVTLPKASLKGTDYSDRTIAEGSERYYVGASRVS